MTAAPDFTDHDTFVAAMTDLLGVIQIDLLPPPIMIGWDDDGLVVHVQDEHAQQWLRSLLVPDYDAAMEFATRRHDPVVRVSGRLDGRRTTITLLYVPMPVGAAS